MEGYEWAFTDAMDLVVMADLDMVDVVMVGMDTGSVAEDGSR